MGLDIQEIKRYNAEYKAYQQKASSTQAEIAVNEREIDKLCAELTQELGIQVTRENAKQVYEERVAKIQEELKRGREVIDRIKAEEAGGGQTGAASAVQGQRQLSGQMQFKGTGQANTGQHNTGQMQQPAGMAGMMGGMAGAGMYAGAGAGMYGGQYGQPQYTMNGQQYTVQQQQMAGLGDLGDAPSVMESDTGTSGQMQAGHVDASQIPALFGKQRVDSV